jgi:hypothetical protein
VPQSSVKQKNDVELLSVIERKGHAEQRKKEGIKIN